MKKHRHVTYAPTIAGEIYERLARGETLREVCRDASVAYGMRLDQSESGFRVTYRPSAEHR